MDFRDKAVRGRVEGSFDVAAMPIVVAHVDDIIILVGNFIALHYCCEILTPTQGVNRMRTRFREVDVLTSGLMYLYNIARGVVLNTRSRVRCAAVNNAVECKRDGRSDGRCKMQRAKDGPTGRCSCRKDIAYMAYVSAISVTSLTRVCSALCSLVALLVIDGFDVSVAGRWLDGRLDDRRATFRGPWALMARQETRTCPEMA